MRAFAILHLAVIVTIGWPGGSLPVNAQTAEIISTYTSTARKDCRAVRPSRSEPDDGFVHLCPGIGERSDAVLRTAIGDLREVRVEGASGRAVELARR